MWRRRRRWRNGEIPFPDYFCQEQKHALPWDRGFLWCKLHPCSVIILPNFNDFWTILEESFIDKECFYLDDEPIENDDKNDAKTRITMGSIATTKEEKEEETQVVITVTASCR